MGKTDIKSVQRSGKESRFSQLRFLIREHWESNPKSMLRNVLFPMFFFIGTIVYLEGTFHLLVYRSIDLKMINSMLLAIPFGMLLTLITGGFHERTNKVLQCILTILVCITYQLQFIYFSIFQRIFSLRAIGLAEGSFKGFLTEFTNAVQRNTGELILLAVPMVAFAILMYGSIDYRSRGYKRQGILLGGFALSQVLVLFLL